MKYFAYGSNMSASRLQERVPSAKRIGFYLLKEHDLRFHKISKKDGSGKCDAYFTRRHDDTVIGTLFEISPDEKISLDKAEGLGVGYEKKEVTLQSQAGDEVKAVTYYATKIDKSLNPYSWYLNHVLVGAKESELPTEYIEKIRATESTQDADKDRDARERAIHSQQAAAPDSENCHGFLRW